MSPLRTALLLDRDGVINIEKNYVYQISDFEFVDGIFELCREAVIRGMAIAVVTNQAGIGRGYYTESQFRQLSDWMLDRFSERGITVDAVYFCPFHPEHGVGPYRKESFDRKPNPGMILRAKTDLSLDLENSILVGDKMSDIEAAHAAGVGRTVLLGSAVAEHCLGPGPSLFVSSLDEARQCLFGAQPVA
ncbi:MAG: family hydrolase [Herminiimonas sp.]|nr:family hydrolase [Herminiimonas sp.]